MPRARAAAAGEDERAFGGDVGGQRLRLAVFQSSWASTEEALKVRSRGGGLALKTSARAAGAALPQRCPHAPAEVLLLLALPVCARP
jgi:hypothetical protein